MSALLHGFCAVSRSDGAVPPAPPRARVRAALTSHGSDASRSRTAGGPSTAGAHRTS